MLSGTYEARNLDTSATVTVELEGRPGGRLVRERIVAFIAEFWADHGYAPSLRDVAEAVGERSVSPVFFHLRLLAAAGRVAYAPGKSRSLRVVQP